MTQSRSSSCRNRYPLLCFHRRALVALFLLTCQSCIRSVYSDTSAPTPSASSELYKDATASVEDRIADLLPRMTLREKIGQMIMDAANSKELAESIGAYLIGPSDAPGNPIESWRTRLNELQLASANHRLGIPLLIGGDAVHGQSLLRGATIFPHNIGLGATRNPDLVYNIAQITAAEILSSGLDLTFAPALSIVQHISWGRTFESYGEDADLVTSYTKPFITGMQGKSMPWQVIATAKHWIGDGATDNGTNAGDVTAPNLASFLEVQTMPFAKAFSTDVGAVMVSFNSVNGVPMHQNTNLITNVLKNEMGFQGFVLTDWEGYSTNTGVTFEEKVTQAVNAGIDLFMCSYNAYLTIDTLNNSIATGLVTESRIDDAVTRVLRTKFKAGLFEKHAQAMDVNDYEPIGTQQHRDVARQAVRESLVLLKNSNSVLPIDKTAKLVLVGKTAHNITLQCGGWTMSWQGTNSDDAHQILGGTTIYEGFSNLTEGSVSLSANASAIDPDKHDIVIAVLGETPYAETLGDNKVLALNESDQAVLAKVKASGLPCVFILVSGRPLIVTDYLTDVDAFVAAWLPGTEGDGIAQVLYGDYDFTGRLSVSWPHNIEQVFDGFIGDNPDVLYPFGYGLNYSVERLQAGNGLSTNSTGSTDSFDNNTTDESADSSSTLSTPSAITSTDSSQSFQPETPKLTDSTPTSLSISWNASYSSIGIKQYNVYDAGVLVGNVTSTSYAVMNLQSGSSHAYTVTAVDTDGTESPQSSPLVASTQILVSDFSNRSVVALNNWGTFKTSQGGTKGNGFAKLDTNVSGFQGYGAELKYVVDSGEWGYSNVYLNFADGAGSNLLAADISGVTFKIKGNTDSTINVHLGTPLAEYVWIFYTTELQLTTSWTIVELPFNEFVTSKPVSYTIQDVLLNCTSLVWETTQVGATGWFLLDDIWFWTPTSTTRPEVYSVPETSGVGQQMFTWNCYTLLASIWITLSLLYCL